VFLFFHLLLARQMIFWGRIQHFVIPVAGGEKANGMGDIWVVCGKVGFSA
jgi:hypothetical protein